MTIRVGNSSVSLEDVLGRVSEIDILSHYFGITEIPCVIHSPLREDKTPSFGFYTSNGRKIHWVDYATNNRGGTFDLLMQLWNCNYVECLNRIYNEMVKQSVVLIKPTLCNIHITHKYNTNVELQCKVRDWKDYDIAYWKSYGITLQWLKWAEVYPISHKIVIKNGVRHLFGAAKYAYAFVEHKENHTTIKIYQPFVKEYKWANGHNGSVLSLWSKIPDKGERLFITSSLKDALNLSCQLHIPAIAPQGEGYSLSNSAVQELKRRYKQIIVFFDNDFSKSPNPGRLRSKILCAKHGFSRIEIPDEYKAKDPSDLYKKYGRDKYLEIINKELSKL